MPTTSSDRTWPPLMSSTSGVPPCLKSSPTVSICEERKSWTSAAASVGRAGCWPTNTIAGRPGSTSAVSSSERPRPCLPLVNLQDKTTFLQGDATSLPFADRAFDVVWTQHVQMNIPDKQKLYSEITRVLKPGGHFLYYDIFRKEDGELRYPMPWAGTAALSFLFREAEMDGILTELGLNPEISTDQTPAGIAFFEGLLARLKTLGPPKLGLNVLMGETTRLKITHLLTHLKSGQLELKSGVYRK